MWIRRLRYWLGSAEREAALRAEMDSHIEEKAAELRERGLDEASARAEARRCFGNIGAAQQESREIWIARYWSDFWQDVRYAARNLKRNPGFAAGAMLSAGLGIGACSIIFAFVNFAIFRTLPVSTPERLMAISGVKKGTPGGSMSYPEIRDIGERMRSWEGVAAFSPFVAAGISSGDAARRHWGFLVTSNYFDVARPEFELGRGFVRGEDDVAGAPAKIVLTHGLWKSRFGGDPSIVGRTIQVNKRAMTVTGVTRAGFRGTETGIVAEFFLPFSQLAEMGNVKQNAERLTDYRMQWLNGLGRLRPGVHIEQARAELATTAAGIRASAPELPRDRRFHIERAGQLLPFLRKIAVPAFLLLLTVALLVLLTACGNVANLMLARASARSAEISTRMAVGASRGRLIRQLMAESLLLALGGGALGVGLASLASRGIAQLRLPVPVPIDLTVSMDYRVVLFSTALSVATAVLFGLLPAFRATRTDLIASMRAGGAIASLGRFGLRNALVVAQVAVSAVLVICSGLFLRSLGAVRGIQSGMNTGNLVLVQFDPALSRYDERQARQLLVDVLHDAGTLAGAQSASMTNLLPLSVGGNFTQVRAAGRASREEAERAALMAVGGRYFETMGIPLIAGRDFGPAPSNEPVAIVNQELARRLYPNQNAIAREVWDGGSRAQIIAVVGDSKYQTMFESAKTPILYRPILDVYASEGAFAGLTVMVRTTLPPAAASDAIRQILLRRDPSLVVNPARTMESHVRDSIFLPRLAAMLFGVCGMAGLLIASIGIYGVVSFSVARRTREIGIRMALGGRPAQVVGMVLRHGALVTLAGIAIGAAGGFALARAAGSLIYGVSATDPVTFISVPLVLMAVALLATAIPARRAAMVDPNRALRTE